MTMHELDMEIRAIGIATFAAAVTLSGFAGEPAVYDAMRCPELKDVRLCGYPSEKKNALFEARMLSRHAQRDVFGEARRAFERRDGDDRRRQVRDLG